MAIRRSPRYWSALVLTLAWTVLAIIQFADFSGEPAPRWRTVALSILAPVCLGLLIFGQARDGRDEQLD